MSTTEQTQNESKRYVGQVKWFNNKAGYGFITMPNEKGEDSDIFTHYSTVTVGDAQYKYLVQGEYVEFELTDSTSDKHEHQATMVTGINGGKLMCETRQYNRATYTPSRSQKTNSQDDGFTRVQKKRVVKKNQKDA